MLKVNREFPYDGMTGEWWLQRAADRAHDRAYKNIAGFVRNSMRHDPHLIVDYACGAGDLLARLSLLFTHSRLLGIDGSSLLLEKAESRFSKLPAGCAARIRLIQSTLPSKAGLYERADLTFYTFPNMMPFDAEDEKKSAGLLLDEIDRKLARKLLETCVPDQADRHLLCSSPRWNPLEHSRSISRDIRRLMKRGGICVRAEYATTRRHEWSECELRQVSFEEGSLDTIMDGTRLRPWFRVLASSYFRSKVLDDVFQQTGDEQDRSGGYLITVLRAI
jgi:SAM-dependent methyltransferase